MARTLHLLRHAEKGFAENGNDFDVPLTSNGHRQAQSLGEYLSQNQYHFDQILCSPSKRTRQTLDSINLDQITEYPEKLYTATPGDLLACVQTLPDKNSSVLIIGHNPTIPMFGLYISNDPRIAERYPACTFTSIKIQSEKWADIQPGINPIENIWYA